MIYTVTFNSAIDCIISTDGATAFSKGLGSRAFIDELMSKLI